MRVGYQTWNQDNLCVESYHEDILYYTSRWDALCPYIDVTPEMLQMAAKPFIVYAVPPESPYGVPINDKYGLVDVASEGFWTEPRRQRKFKELEKLLNTNNKEKTQESIQKMQLDNKEMAKEMDRMLELFKKLEVEQKTKENIDRLNTLSEEQKSINEQLTDKKPDIPAVKDAQNKLNKDFQDLKKDFADLMKKNEELSDKSEIQNPEYELNEIENELNKSKNELDNNKSNKASAAQKSAADKMKALADKMKKQQEAGEAQELDLKVNIEVWRTLATRFMPIMLQKSWGKSSSHKLIS